MSDDINVNYMKREVKNEFSKILFKSVLYNGGIMTFVLSNSFYESILQNQ